MATTQAALFADLPADVSGGFDAGLLIVITRFRGVLAARAPDEAMTRGKARLGGGSGGNPHNEIEFPAF